MTEQSTGTESSGYDERTVRHNVAVETAFSLFNGLFLGLIWFGSHVVAERCLGAGAIHLAILVSAFPAGAFLGPLWAAIGRRWGMKRLVRGCLLIGGMALLPVYFVADAWSFTLLVAVGQLMNSAMRMGQSSLYRVLYPADRRGRIVGRLTFWTYCLMVTGMLATGFLLDVRLDIYRWIYPLAGASAIGGSLVYGWLRVTQADEIANRSRAGERLVDLWNVLRDDRLYRLYETAFFLTGGAFFLSRPVLVKLTALRFDFSGAEMMFVLSVLPTLLLALGSPLWGWVLDRIGLLRCRLLISLALSAALASFFVGLYWQIAWLLYLGSILQGISNGGGTLTWFLGSSLLARRTEDVPLYNGVHFVLNGIRGMALPWVGALLMGLSGPGAVLAAIAVSLGSGPLLLRAIALGDQRGSGNASTALSLPLRRRLPERPPAAEAENDLCGAGTGADSR